MNKHRKKSLISAIIFAIMVPSLWFILLYIQLFSPNVDMHGNLSYWTTRPVEKIAYFIGMPDESPVGKTYLYSLIAGVLVVLSWIGFGIGTVFVWLLGHLNKKKLS